MNGQPSCSQVSDTVLELGCPETRTGGWFAIGSMGVPLEPRVIEPGLTCSNVMTRLFTPELRPVRVEPGLDAALPNQVAAMSAGLFRELYAMEGSFSVPFGNANTIERCGDFAGAASEFETGLERLLQGCSCSCSADETCPACWEDYLATCESLYATSSGLVNRELQRAFRDDIIHQTNIARFLPMLVAMTPYTLGETTCDGTCATLVMLNQALVWAEWIGGRTAGELARAPTFPASEYLQCVAAAPAECGGPAEEVSDPTRVPCLCLGAGLFSACIQGDGSLEVKAAAVLAVGAKVNLNEGLSSLRVGFGADVGVKLGPLGFGVSQMAWWDASTDTWTDGGVSFDVGVAGPSGTGIKGAPGVCDGWQADAAEVESSEEGLAIEATPDGPN